MKRIALLLGVFCCLFQPPSSAAKDAYPSPIRPENATSYTLTINHVPIAYVQGYTYDGGLLLSLDELFEALHFTTHFDADTATLSGYYKDPSQAFRIDTVMGEVTKGGRIRRYNPQQVEVTEQGIFAEVRFFYDYFNFDIGVDFALAELRLKHKRQNEATPHIAQVPVPEELPDTMPPPAPKLEELAHLPELPAPKEKVPKTADPPVVAQAVPQPAVQPQITDQTLENRVTDVEITRPEGGILPVAEGASDDLHVEQSVEIDPDKFLIFEMSIKDLVYESLLDVYQQDNHYYLGLSQIAEALQFAIKVDDKSGSATGWFISEDNTFRLDVKGLKASVGGREYPLSPGDVFVDNSDIFVLRTQLQQWFPLEIGVNYNGQILDIRPTMLLPMQAKKEREQSRERWKERRKSGKDYPHYIVPYGDALEWPYADITLGSEYASAGGESTLTSEYSGVFAMDLGPLNTQWFMSGTEQEFSDLRVTGTRRDVDGDLFGMGLTSLEVGDVNSFETPLVNGSVLGRGVAVSSYSLERATQFDTTTIQGNEQPGWEVELYNNTTLVDFQVIGDDGRYEFRDVPILYGSNTIKLVFYGPQGEIREEIKRFSIADAILKEGEMNYRLSVNEENKDFLPVSKQDDGSIGAIGQIEYGLTDRLTTTWGTTYAELEDGEHIYESLALTTTVLEDIITQGNIAYDTTTGGSAMRLTANTSVLNTNVRFQQELFNDFMSAAEQNSGGGARLSDTSIDLNGTTHLPGAINLPYTLGIEHEVYDGGKAVTSLSNALSTSLLGFSFTNRLNAQLQEDAGGSTTQMEGTLSARGRYRDAIVRLDTGYTIDPKSELQSVGVSVQRNLTSKLNTVVDINKSLIGEKELNLAGSLNWDHKDYRLSARLEGDDSGDFLIGMNLSFSLYQDPRTRQWYVQNESVAESGMISASAFLDANHNGVQDEGEATLNDAGYRVSGRNKQRNEDGSITITGIAADDFTDVSVDEGTLEDVFWQSIQEGYAVFGRPGVTTMLNFPIVETSEIEGTVYLDNEPVPGIRVFLLTNDGQRVKETLSEFDGLFIFEKVMQGDYRIVLDDVQLKSLEMKAEGNLSLQIMPGSEVYDGQDITLLRRDGADAPAENTEPEEFEEREEQDNAPLDFIPEPNIEEESEEGALPRSMQWKKVQEAAAHMPSSLTRR